ncbi:hypothetical protein KSF_066270 [Reticulibacter mediterranei]|uniref:histidine kinase n=1 Tax=Reticulibacter mediterranei TaxID=2778369 RepID=A0A8J3N2Z1_9CHLR|nr:ATP-binding protein [Reticulibacter mediterranei]GHO96579.1 hypothetical protein KSF_066270 [Reticulibacter mediterranei]
MQRPIMSSLPSTERILEHLSVGIALFEAHTWRFLTADTVFESLLDPQWQQGRARGHPFRDVFSETQASDIEACFCQVVEKGCHMTLTWPLFQSRLDTATSWLWELRPLHNSSGQIDQVLVTASPMTMQIMRQRQAVIAAMRERLRHTPQESALLAQAEVDTLHTFYHPLALAVYAPLQAYQNVTLLATRTTLQQEDVAHMPPQLPLDSQGVFFKAAHERTPVLIDVAHSLEDTQNREERWWLTLPKARHVLCVPLWCRDQWEGMLVAAFEEDAQAIEMHVQTLMEGGSELAEELVHARCVQELEEARRRVSKILDYLPEGILLVEATTGKIRYANTIAAQVLGRPREDLVNHSLNEWTWRRGTDHQQLMEWNFAVIYALSGKALTSQECLVNKPDGRTAIILCSAAPLYNTAGGLVEAVLVFQDITAHKSLEQQKNEFFAMANHELRTPLTSIIGYAELLRLQTAHEPASSFQQEALGHILEEGDHLTRLIQDLQEVSSLDYAQLKLTIGTHDLRDLVVQQVQIVAEQTKTHTFRLLLDDVNPTQALWGRVDAQRIKQIIRNVLSNAIKYSAFGTEITVGIHAFRDARGIPYDAEIRIRDQGIGIAAHDLPHIFQRFYRASSLDAATSGFGVGLYLTHALVERHGGKIRVESQEGQGSTFFILLPLLRDQYSN